MPDASPPPSPREVALSPREAATAMGLSLETLHRLIRRRKIAHSRVGRRIVLLRADLETFLLANRVDAEAPAPSRPR